MCQYNKFIPVRFVNNKAYVVSTKEDVLVVPKGQDGGGLNHTLGWPVAVDTPQPPDQKGDYPQ